MEELFQRDYTIFDGDWWMDDENYKKAEKLANIAEIILLVSIVLILAVFFSISELNWIIMIIALPLYMTGFVIAIIARDTCDECAEAKFVLKYYIIITIVLVVVATICILVVAACNSCMSTFDCNGCFDTFLKCPGWQYLLFWIFKNFILQ